MSGCQFIMVIPFVVSGWWLVVGEKTSRQPPAAGNFVG
jgi:hypothetical protein